MKKYNKLVRDLIPDILDEKGQEYVIRKARNDREYFFHLRNKLLEEVSEFMTCPSAEELADIREVVNALAFQMGLTVAELEDVRLKKRADRGGFSRQWILEEA